MTSLGIMNGQHSNMKNVILGHVIPYLTNNFISNLKETSIKTLLFNREREREKEVERERYLPTDQSFVLISAHSNREMFVLQLCMFNSSENSHTLYFYIVFKRFDSMYPC